MTDNLLYEFSSGTGDRIEVGVSKLRPGMLWVKTYGLPMLTPEQAMELGTALTNAAFPHTATARERQLAADIESGAVDDAMDRAVRHRVGESGACDCPQCISMAVGHG